MDKKPAELILVADDDATSRKLLVRILSSAGYCLHARPRMESKRWTRCTPSTPSLLLLDFDMPGMDGAEVLKQLRQDARCRRSPNFPRSC